MSNQLSSLDFSDLADPYLRPTLPPTSSPSTAVPDYQNFNPLTPKTLDAWIVASHPTQTAPTHPPDLLSSLLPARLDQTSTNPLPLKQPQSVSVPSANTFMQPDRMLYTAPVRSSVPAKPQLSTNLNTAPESPSLIPSVPPPSDGLSAVQRAKKVADQFTMSQLAKKRKAAALHSDPKRPRNLPSSKSSTDEDEKHADHLPERISHRKYQKRLQKNRDSAFVSRIRRREYTRLLEESLTNTEKEKDAAVNGFLEMKRRFDIVSAELNAFKQALAPNFTALKDSLFTQLSTSSADTKPPRSASAVTSMFMFTLLFGILLPGSVRHRLGLQRSSADVTHVAVSTGETKQNGIRSILFGNTFAKTAPHVNNSRGKVWGQFPATLHPNQNVDKDHDNRRQDALSTIEEASLDLLGAKHSQQFVTLTRSYLNELSTTDIDRLEKVFRRDNATRFEQLVEIQSLTRQVEPLPSKEGRFLLDHVTLQLENARL